MKLAKNSLTAAPNRKSLNPSVGNRKSTRSSIELVFACSHSIQTTCIAMQMGILCTQQNHNPYTLISEAYQQLICVLLQHPAVHSTKPPAAASSIPPAATMMSICVAVTSLPAVGLPSMARNPRVVIKSMPAANHL